MKLNKFYPRLIMSYNTTLKLLSLTMKMFDRKLESTIQKLVRKYLSIAGLAENVIEEPEKSIPRRSQVLVVHP